MYQYLPGRTIYGGIFALRKRITPALTSSFGGDLIFAARHKDIDMYVGAGHYTLCRMVPRGVLVTVTDLISYNKTSH